jgi:surface antigen/uncharacterized lipoprotein NlpE involved in copper resistance
VHCHLGHRAHSWIVLWGVAAFALGSLPAAPQTGLTFTNSPFAQFTDEDNKLFLEAVRKAASGAPGGAPVDWANAGSGAKGTVRYTRALTGRPEGDCREMQGDNTARGRTEQFRVTVCKDPKGQWRLATNSPKAKAQPTAAAAGAGAAASAGSAASGTATASSANTGFPQTLPAIFSGVLPCADCPGMEYRIDLRDDGSYRMRTTYQERGPNHSGLNVDDAGAWQLVHDNARVTLRSDANTTMTFAIRDPDTLRLLDKSGHEIKGKLNYDLKRSATYTPLEAAP